MLTGGEVVKRLFSQKISPPSLIPLYLAFLHLKHTFPVKLNNLWKGMQSCKMIKPDHQAAASYMDCIANPPGAHPAHWGCRRAARMALGLHRKAAVDAQLVQVPVTIKARKAGVGEKDVKRFKIQLQLPSRFYCLRWANFSEVVKSVQLLRTLQLGSLGTPVESLKLDESCSKRPSRSHSSPEKVTMILHF